VDGVFGVKCKHCKAPVGHTEDGRIRFDSSQYHMDAVKKLSQISALNAYIKDLEEVVNAAREEVTTGWYHQRIKESLAKLDQ